MSYIACIVPDQGLPAIHNTQAIIVSNACIVPDQGLPAIHNIR